jgi:hypothetical protein
VAGRGPIQKPGYDKLISFLFFNLNLTPKRDRGDKMSALTKVIWEPQGHAGNKLFRHDVRLIE